MEDQQSMPCRTNSQLAQVVAKLLYGSGLHIAVRLRVKGMDYQRTGTVFQRFPLHRSGSAVRASQHLLFRDLSEDAVHCLSAEIVLLHKFLRDLLHCTPLRVASR